MEQTQRDSTAGQVCPDCHAFTADLVAHEQWHSRLVHDIAVAVDREARRRVDTK